MQVNYEIGDFVFYNEIIYEVVSVHAINWFQEKEPTVLGLIDVNKKHFNLEITYVREGLLRKASQEEVETWGVLYGKRKRRF